MYGIHVQCFYLLPSHFHDLILFVLPFILLAELVLLIWGVKLCIAVRNAPSDFNESRFISWAIYNETLLVFFLNLAL